MSIKLLVKKKKGTKTHPDENRAVPTEANGSRRLGETSQTQVLPIFNPKHQSGQFSRFLGFKAEGFLKGREKDTQAATKPQVNKLSL